MYSGINNHKIETRRSGDLLNVLSQCSHIYINNDNTEESYHNLIVAIKLAAHEAGMLIYRNSAQTVKSGDHGNPWVNSQCANFKKLASRAYKNIRAVSQKIR